MYVEDEPRQSLSPRVVHLPPELEPKFEAFWKAYPSRGGYTNPKKAAKVSYLRAVTEGADPEILTKQALAYHKWCEIMGTTRTNLVAMASTWLNQTRWENDYTIGWHMLQSVKDQHERSAMEIRLEHWQRSQR